MIPLYPGNKYQLTRQLVHFLHHVHCIIAVRAILMACFIRLFSEKMVKQDDKMLALW